MYNFTNSSPEFCMNMATGGRLCSGGSWFVVQLSLEVLPWGSFHLCIDDLVLWLVGFIRQEVGIELEDLGSQKFSLCFAVPHAFQVSLSRLLQLLVTVIILLGIFSILHLKYGSFSIFQSSFNALAEFSCFLNFIVRPICFTVWANPCTWIKMCSGVPDTQMATSLGEYHLEEEILGVGFEKVMKWIMLGNITHGEILPFHVMLAINLLELFGHRLHI
jgi:hypothetical protein